MNADSATRPAAIVAATTPALDSPWDEIAMVVAIARGPTIRGIVSGDQQRVRFLGGILIGRIALLAARAAAAQHPENR